MKRWPALATEGTDNYSLDWTARLPSGVTLTSVAYEADPENGLTFANNVVSGNVSSVDITANTTEREYTIKCTPTLSSGNITPVSVFLKVNKHVFA